MSKCTTWGGATPVDQDWTDLRVCPITYDDGSELFYSNGKKVLVGVFKDIPGSEVFYDNSKAVTVSLVETAESTSVYFINGKTVTLRRLR